MAGFCENMSDFSTTALSADIASPLTLAARAIKVTL